MWKSIAYAKVAEDGQLIEFEVLVCRDDGHAVHLAKRRAFSGWNTQKTMTNVEQQDARLIAMDGAVVAAIRLHAPEFEAAYLADDLPRWLQCLLDRCTATAERVADRADDDAFIEILSALLGDALGHGQITTDHDAPGIVPEARSSVCSGLFIPQQRTCRE